MIGGNSRTSSRQLVSPEIAPAENPMRNPGNWPYRALFSANHTGHGHNPGTPIRHIPRIILFIPTIKKAKIKSLKSQNKGTKEWQFAHNDSHRNGCSNCWRRTSWANYRYMLLPPPTSPARRG